jgi:hypothetical protein
MEFFDEEECPACECERTIKELEDTWNRELVIYEKRSGNKYDYYQFFDAALAGNVDKKHLRGLPELKLCLQHANYLIEEYNYTPPTQLKLFELWTQC